MNQLLINQLDVGLRRTLSRRRNKILRRMSVTLEPLFASFFKSCFEATLKQSGGLPSHWPGRLCKAMRPNAVQDEYYHAIKDGLRHYSKNANIAGSRFRELSSCIAIDFDCRIVSAVFRTHFGTTIKALARARLYGSGHFEDCRIHVELLGLEQCDPAQLAIVETKLEEHLPEVMVWATLRA